MKLNIDTGKKWMVIFLIAGLGYGLQLAYSSPVALSRTYFDELKISEQTYGLLFTFYSLPNLFMVLIGGILIDILGTTPVSLVFCGIAVVASIVTAIALPHFNIMMAARFFLGLGGETVLACTTTMVPLWYSPKEVPLFMGFLSCWFYWGNLTALVLLPAINSMWGFKAALGCVGFIFTICFCLYLLLIKFRESLRWSDDSSMSRINSAILLQKISSTNSISMDNEEMEVDGMNSPTEMSVVDGDEGETEVRVQNRTKLQEFLVRLGEVKHTVRALSTRFWLLSAICFVSYYTMFGLAIIGTDVLEVKFKYNEQKAALIMASEAVINGFCPILTGVIMQRIRGWRIRLMMLGSFLLGMGTLLLNVTDVYPLPWIILCGIGFSILNTTLMSCVPLMVDMSIVGTAYGIVVTSYNLNIVIFPPILDAIKHHTGNYTIPLAFLTLTSVISIILLSILKYMDMKVPLNQSLDSPLSTAGIEDLTITDSTSLIHNHSLNNIDVNNNNNEEIQQNNDDHPEDEEIKSLRRDIRMSRDGSTSFYPTTTSSSINHHHHPGEDNEDIDGEVDLNQKIKNSSILV